MDQKFISFEGGDGAGKTTQIKKLAAYLQNKGEEVFSTREPGGSTGAEKIRNILLAKENEWDALTELYLFLASRNDHIDNFILPHLRNGAWVLCDRYHFSTVAYQAYAGDLELELVQKLSQPVLEKACPAAVMLLDIDPEEGLKRVNSRSENQTRFDMKSLDYHKRVRQGFLELASSNTIPTFVIDAKQDEESVFQQILSAVNDGII